MLIQNQPALILAPMDGITDAPMRAVQGESGAFTFAVSEFLRISGTTPPRRVFQRHVPELCHDSKTPTGLRVQLQLLGGDAGRMAQSAAVAISAGAQAIDLNFGCPAPTVNRHDGGATLLKSPHRIREVVAAVRDAVPASIPVSAKLRLGWDSLEEIYENAEMAAQGGASWLTIHGRTRLQGYLPPAHWKPIGQVRRQLSLPIVANGDIWTIEDFRRCRDETGCIHFMLGRGALADPLLAARIAYELGTLSSPPPPDFEWSSQLARLVHYTHRYENSIPLRTVFRLKQWLKLAHLYGDFSAFDEIKRCQTTSELFAALEIVLPSCASRKSEVALSPLIGTR